MTEIILEKSQIGVLLIVTREIDLVLVKLGNSEIDVPAKLISFMFSAYIDDPIETNFLHLASCLEYDILPNARTDNFSKFSEGVKCTNSGDKISIYSKFDNFAKAEVSVISVLIIDRYFKFAIPSIPFKLAIFPIFFSLNCKSIFSISTQRDNPSIDLI